MSLPSPLITTRLRLLPLNIEQLRQVLAAPEQLEAALNLRLARGMLTPVVQNAIHSKLTRLASMPPEARAWRTYWLIIIAAEDLGAGLAGFKGTPDEKGAVEIGYGIDPSRQGRGYMTEAARALTRWAFTQPACRSVTAQQVRNDNLASQQVLKTNGFECERFGVSMQDWRLTRLEYALRPTRLDDAAEIERLYRQSAETLAALGDHSPHVFDAAAYLRDGFGPDPAFAGLAAARGEQLLGYVLYSFSYDTDSARRRLFVLDLLVDQAVRGRGLGAALMQAAADFGRARGAAEVYWAVYPANQRATDFYRRLGAHEAAELRYMVWPIDRPPTEP